MASFVTGTPESNPAPYRLERLGWVNGPMLRLLLASGALSAPNRQLREEGANG